MRLVALILLAAGFVTGARAEDPPRPKAPDLPKLSPEAEKALATLQGDWKVVQITLDGKDMEPDAGEEVVVTFKGRKIIFSSDGKPIQEAVVVALDPSTKPPCIDVSKSASDTRVEEAVYKIDGDTLLYHSYKGKDKNRPTGFDTSKDTATMLLKAQRIKK